MRKRVLAGSLWFSAMLLAWEIAWSLLGVPRAVGPILAVVVSALVVLDPAGLFFEPLPGRSQRASSSWPRGRPPC